MPENKDAESLPLAVSLRELARKLKNTFLSTGAKPLFFEVPLRDARISGCLSPIPVDIFTLIPDSLGYISPIKLTLQYGLFCCPIVELMYTV